MSDIKGRYKQIIEDLENKIKEPEQLYFVKDKFSELSMLFIDMLDRVTRLTDSKIQQIDERQQEISKRISSIQAVVDEIEDDIYDYDENYEFEIVCPYCNYEFTADMKDENKDEVQCPECLNTIELDWNIEEGVDCLGNCSHCETSCGVAEDDEKYNVKNKKENKEDEEDM